MPDDCVAQHSLQKCGDKCSATFFGQIDGGMTFRKPLVYGQM